MCKDEKEKFIKEAWAESWERIEKAGREALENPKPPDPFQELTVVDPDPPYFWESSHED